MLIIDVNVKLRIALVFSLSFNTVNSRGVNTLGGIMTLTEIVNVQ